MAFTLIRHAWKKRERERERSIVDVYNAKSMQKSMEINGNQCKNQAGRSKAQRHEAKTPLRHACMQFDRQMNG